MGFCFLLVCQKRCFPGLLLWNQTQEQIKHPPKKESYQSHLKKQKKTTQKNLCNHHHQSNHQLLGSFKLKNLVNHKGTHHYHNFHYILILNNYFVLDLKAYQDNQRKNPTQKPQFLQVNQSENHRGSLLFPLLWRVVVM